MSLEALLCSALDPTVVALSDGLAHGELERLRLAKIAAAGLFALLVLGLALAYRVTTRKLEQDAAEATLEAAFRELEADGARKTPALDAGKEPS